MDKELETKLDEYLRNNLSIEVKKHREVYESKEYYEIKLKLKDKEISYAYID